MTIAADSHEGSAHMNYFQRVSKHFRADLYPWMYWLGHLIPKHSRLWVFGSGHGKSFTDNSKHLFLYMQRQHRDDYRCVWLTRDRSTCEALSTLGYEVYDMHSWRGCWLSLRAGVAVASYGYAKDLNAFAITKRTKLIQLWHGTPLKKLGTHDRFDSTRVFPGHESQRWGLYSKLNLPRRRFVHRFFPHRR